VPRDWIISITPVVLSFFYLRFMSLYDSEDEIEHEFRRIAPEVISGEDWKLDQNRFDALSENTFWFKNLPMAGWRNKGCLYDIIQIIIWFVALIALFIIPVPIIGYFIRLVWLSQPLYISLIVSGVSIMITLLAVIILIIQVKTEMQ